MQLPANEVFTHLLQAGVTHLHHANTVTTSCGFIRQKHLIARGCMDRMGLNQTPQASDENDKAQGVYHDIFLDSVDIHGRARRRNRYGPVLFKLSVERLRAMNLPPFWVTRSNPLYWNGDTQYADKWFQSFVEFQLGFVVGQFEQMIVLRHMGGVLPLADCLCEIVLDNPGLDEPGFDLFTLSLGAIMQARVSTPNPLCFDFNQRTCAEGCGCTAEYRQDTEATHDLFIPQRTAPPQPAQPANAPHD